MDRGTRPYKDFEAFSHWLLHPAIFTNDEVAATYFLFRRTTPTTFETTLTNSHPFTERRANSSSNRARLVASEESIRTGTDSTHSGESPCVGRLIGG